MAARRLTTTTAALAAAAATRPALRRTATAAAAATAAAIPRRALGTTAPARQAAPPPPPAPLPAEMPSPDTYQHIKVSTCGKVGIVRLHRPKALNGTPPAPASWGGARQRPDRGSRATWRGRAGGARRRRQRCAAT